MSSASQIFMARAVSRAVTSRLRAMGSSVRSTPAPSASTARAHQQRRSVQRTRVISAAYANEKVGDFPSLEFRCFIKDEAQNTVSAWHGVPLKNADGTFNFLCEIPKETKAKMEVATDEKLTPIIRTTSTGTTACYRKRGKIPSTNTRR